MDGSLDYHMGYFGWGGKILPFKGLSKTTSNKLANQELLEIVFDVQEGSHCFCTRHLFTFSLKGELCN